VLRLGGAPVVMPRGCRLRLNLVTKDRVSVVVCDQCNFVSVDSIVVPYAWRLAGGSLSRRANVANMTSYAICSEFDFGDS
jgi:hypothetical protein